MTAFGFALLLLGAVLVVAEAHAPSGVLGVSGGLFLIAGGIVLIAALGGGAGLAVPVGVGLGLTTSGAVLLASGKVSGVRRLRSKVGAEALCGRVGVVRRWTEPAGHVFVDGALWRARHESSQSDSDTLQEGDPVVVERVSGLTLSVRRAEEWELFA
jgi:membrane-bound ClpP family serine protease